MGRQGNGKMADLGLLALRGTTGGLMMGHGAQKLWGLFGGYGLQGTAGWLESIGLKPGQTWALMAGRGEFGSGLLTALGFLGPMARSACLVRWGRPGVLRTPASRSGSPVAAPSCL